MTLFTWYLLASFHIHTICTLWIPQPSPADYLAAGCGSVEYFTGNGFQVQHLPDNVIEVTDDMQNEVLCVVSIAHEGEPTTAEFVDQCGYRMDLITAHEIDRWELVYTHEPEPPAAACTLPPVDNAASIATHEPLEFLAGRLSWWGVDLSVDEWQNRYDESIRGAADAAGVPASMLKSMIGHESQYWPLWTGSEGEIGLLQLTWDGADTALRYSPDLFSRYCPQAIAPPRCMRGYDLLASWEKSRVQTALVNDLRLEGTPPAAYAMAAADYWTYAHILRSFACYTQTLYPSAPDLWTATLVVYNAGTECLSADGLSICEQGQRYLESVR